MITERQDAVWDAGLETFVHPVAAMFPKLEEESEDFRRLEGSMSSMGQLEPIVYDGEVLLDGRHRLAVCRKYRTTPVIKQWKELDIQPLEKLDEIQTVVAWIIAKNIIHRYLTEDQRAAIVAKAEAWELEAWEAIQKGQFKKGIVPNPAGLNQYTRKAETHSSPPSKRDSKQKDARSTVGKVAKKANVSYHKARQALKLKKEAPDLLDDVSKNKATLKDATKKLPKTNGQPKRQPAFRDRVLKGLKRLLDSFGDEKEEAIRIIKEQLQ